MLSAEKREKARERWMEMFDAVYSKNESLFSCGTTLIVTNTDTMTCYGEDGLAYTLQVAPWEKESEDAISREYALGVIYSSNTYPRRADIHRAIENAPSVLPKRSCYRCGLREDCEDSTDRKLKEAEWIPCSEKMPTNKGHYLCSFTKSLSYIDNVYVGEGYWTGVSWHGLSSNIINAWMPLPKPFKGADE